MYFKARSWDPYYFALFVNDITFHLDSMGLEQSLQLCRYDFCACNADESHKYINLEADDFRLFKWFTDSHMKLNDKKYNSMSFGVP